MLLFVMGLFASCSETEQGHGSSLDNPQDVIEDDVEDDTEDDGLEIVPWTPEPEPPPPECIECDWYFCPPLDEVWRKEICFNICE